MPETTHGRPRLLIADDDIEIRNVFRQFLCARYECWAVSSAEKALALLSAAAFDLVLCDITLRGMSGLELIARARALSPDTVIILISGEQTITHAIDAMRAGAFDYLTKPFNLQHVEIAVRRGLEHRALLVDKRRHENHLTALAVQRAGEIDRTFKSLEEAYRMTLKALAAALEARDRETHGHSERVVTFSLRLGRELGLSPTQLRALEFGALLHDIGKIGVPDAVLHKPAKLSEEEWMRMRLHPAMGSRILSGIDFLAGAARVVAEHHEQWDG
ncbi:MAG: response regulator, partial [Acidobacteriota bacterium]|nr:response regulator [Acidobacteriota bacterium]